jgi:hypothetical protein
MAKRNIETTIYVARGENWHVTMDRETRDFAAFIDDGMLILIGFFDSRDDAVNAIRKYIREGLVAA